MTHLITLKNLASGILLVALGVGALWATAEFPRGVPPAGDPALLPRTLGVGLIAIGVLLLAMAVVERLRGVTGTGDGDGVPINLPVDVPEERSDHEEEDESPKLWLPVAVSVVLVAYSFAAFRIGFFTSTSAVIIGLALLLGRQRSRGALIGLVIFALVAAAVVYIGFFELLSVRQPDTPVL